MNNCNSVRKRMCTILYIVTLFHMCTIIYIHM